MSYGDGTMRGGQVKTWAVFVPATGCILGCYRLRKEAKRHLFGGCTIVRLTGTLRAIGRES